MAAVTLPAYAESGRRRPREASTPLQLLPQMLCCVTPPFQAGGNTTCPEPIILGETAAVPDDRPEPNRSTTARTWPDIRAVTSLRG